MDKVKDYLLQAKRIDVNIESMLEQVAQLRAMTIKITATWKQEPGGGGGNHDKIGDAVARIVDLENEINDKVDAYIEKKREISGVLAAVKDADQAAVLHKRYLLYEGWDQIALELHCTVRNVTYIHGRALQSVKDILEDKGILEREAQG